MPQDTALHNAALNDQAKAVDLLLKLECNLTYNKDGQSAIDYAIMNKFTEVAYVMATHKHRYSLNHYCISADGHGDSQLNLDFITELTRCLV